MNFKQLKLGKKKIRQIIGITMFIAFFCYAFQLNFMLEIFFRSNINNFLFIYYWFWFMWMPCIILIVLTILLLTKVFKYKEVD